MSTVVEQCIDLTFVANVAQLHLLVRDFENHRSLAVSFSLLEAACVDVAGFGIDHLTLAVGFARFPFTRVGVAVCVVHGPLA